MSLQSLSYRRPCPTFTRVCKPTPPIVSRSVVGLCFNRLLTSRKELNEEIGLIGCPGNGATVFCMRHQKRVPKLGKPSDQRKALLRGLTTQVLLRGQIKTTLVRAKAVRKYVDKMITLAKDGSLHARRQVLAFVYQEKNPEKRTLVNNLFEKAGEKFGSRNGGYCRVKRQFARRKGDGAEMAIIELVD
eukprot:TRINITY_DN4218_c0_g1_i24.p3 TRINITY_DN4218_c0_g1~~TRINITY_DN4218_c0_g1_i24.p3  ORF type:complete len:188 (+),score=19.53 TRINITY_DN4218_c0_g1_i24:148-711(+)